MIYYISDLHFGHINILKHREVFSSLDEMHSTLLNNWRRTVTPEDTVYVLGDICYNSPISASDIMQELPGHKHLLLGNHDDPALADRLDVFHSVFRMKTIEDVLNGESVRVFLCHYPLAEWPEFYKGSYHLYGHIHNTLGHGYQTMYNQDRAFNVSAEIMNYTPQTLGNVMCMHQAFKRSHPLP